MFIFRIYPENTPFINFIEITSVSLLLDPSNVQNKAFRSYFLILDLKAF